MTEQSTNKNENFIIIGDSALIKARKDLEVNIPPGGKLSEYIPFYLGPRSPMLYQIATGYEDVKKFPQEEIVYLISSFEKIKEHGCSFFFTDGHARSATAAKYNNEKDFDKLDWNVIKATFWKSDESDLRRKEKKQSEFLVKDYVPWTCIELVGVYNDNAREKVLNLARSAGTTVEVKISKAKLYYDHL